MKKVLMIAAMMIATLSASAQNEVGQVTLKPMVGMNLATMTDTNDSKLRVGLAAGVEAEYGITENFGIDFGVLYSMEGCKYPAADFVNFYIPGAGNLVDGNANFNFDYINIPILAQFYPAKGFAIKAGVQPGFLLSCKSKWSDNESVNIY